jgi:hypothetical protein
MLAMQAGLPLVPISVVGSRHVMKKGELTTRPGACNDRPRADRHGGHGPSVDPTCRQLPIASAKSFVHASRPKLPAEQKRRRTMCYARAALCLRQLIKSRDSRFVAVLGPRASASAPTSRCSASSTSVFLRPLAYHEPTAWCVELDHDRAAIDLVSAFSYPRFPEVQQRQQVFTALALSCAQRLHADCKVDPRAGDRAPPSTGLPTLRLSNACSAATFRRTKIEPAVSASVLLIEFLQRRFNRDASIGQASRSMAPVHGDRRAAGSGHVVSARSHRRLGAATRRVPFCARRS